MTTDFTKEVSLKQVVAYTLDENVNSVAEFDRYWVLAFRALVYMHFEILAEPVTKRLPVNANKTVYFPPDYLSWTKIGIMNEKGEVCTLKVNDALSTFKDNNPNRLPVIPNVNNAVPTMVGSPLYLNYYYNGVYQNYYGLRGGLIQFGECKVDEENKVIVLNPEFRYANILLEYISSPQKNDDYTIPIYAQEAVIAFIKWKTKQGNAREFYNELKVTRRHLNGKKVSLQKVNQVLRESTGQFLKS